MPILQLDPLVCDPNAAQRVVAFCKAFNTSFDVVITFAVYLLPIVAAVRLVQRS